MDAGLAGPLAPAGVSRQNEPVRIHKLESTDAFVLFDLDDAERSVGVVRLAPKILRDGAELLARSMTYTFASFGVRQGGASAGVNARPEGRTDAVAAFVAEVEPLVVGGQLVLAAGRGIADADLASLAAVSPSPAPEASAVAELLAAGVVAAARAATGGLEGRTVAVEGLDVAGPGLASALAAAGARIVAVGTSLGSVLDPSGLAPERLTGDDGRLAPLGDLGGVEEAADAVFAVEADVLVVGSKPGVLDHRQAAGVRAKVVVPSGPVPVTAKGLAVLRRSGALVLADFLSAAGPRFASFPDVAGDADLDALASRAGHDIAAAVAADLGHEDGPLLVACYRAEAFLGTWRDRLPFGRPLA